MFAFPYLLLYAAPGIIVAASIPRPCRLPSEYNQMPDFAREKLQSIWENYESGKSCVAEQVATDVILAIVDIFPAKYRYEVNQKIRSGHNYDSTSGHSSTSESVHVEITETTELPEFLKNASKDVVNNFTKVWNDENIPSEGLREEMIHLLAVSLLTTEQLSAYNQYMQERRRCQQQLLLDKSQMSDDAQKALDILTYAEPEERSGIVKNYPHNIRRELKNFARRKTGKCV